MNEQLQNALTQLISKLIQGLEFGADQIPEVLVDVMKWNSLVSWIWCGAGVILTGIGLTLFILLIKDVICEYSESDSQMSLAVFSLIAVALGLVFILGNLDWLQIWISPKAWTLEYLRNFISGG